MNFALLGGMARPARIEYAGAFYHVMNRGNNKEVIFVDHHDREKFYQILGNVEKRYGIIIYAFALIPNHYHLFLETVRPNLSRALQRLNGDYALYFSKRHKKPGHIFQGRFKAMLVQKEAYMLELSRYIHLNPIRAGVCNSPEEYEWSSYPYYINTKEKPNLPFNLCTEWILSVYGSQRDIAAEKYREFVLDGIKTSENIRLNARGGWILGSKSWAKGVIKKHGNFSSGELSGVRPLRKEVLVADLQSLICSEFNIEEADLKKTTRNNLAKKTIIYFAVNCCGLTLDETAKRYNSPSNHAIFKTIDRFKNELAEDHELRRKVDHIKSIVKM